MADRNRFALRRTGRAHPGAVAAQRRDRPPRRARPQVRTGRPARRSTAQRAGDRAAGRRLSQPIAGVSDRDAGRRAPDAARRAHRAAPQCPGVAGSCCWPSTPTKSVRRCASVTGSTWPACSPTPRRTISYYVDAGCARPPMHCRDGARRVSPAGAPRRSTKAWSSSGGEVMLARDARPERDPGLILRVAAASATTGLPMSASTLPVLAETAPELRTPWPRPGAQGPAGAAGRGPTAVATIEALDRTGLWGRLFPEWGAVRDLPPRDIVHIWTVDRHLVETVSRASAFTTGCRRPDLLVLGALLPRHRQGPRRRPQRDRRRTGDADRHPAGPVAVGRRDPVQAWCATTCCCRTPRRGGICRTPRPSPRWSTRSAATSSLLELLHALAEADSLATGPGVWGDWKASLIGDLVRRCRLVMAGEPLPQPDPD